MIEMLGVLAIIGVLSAGGIWGYNIAMDNHKINRFISMLSEMRTGFLSIPSRKIESDMVIYTDGLCKSKVLPDDFCSAKIGDDRYRKGYFGEKTLAYTYTTTTTGSNGWTFARLDGSRARVARPSTNITFVIYTAFPTSQCAKLLSSSAWKSFGDLVIVDGLSSVNSGGMTELPLSPAIATTACKSAMSGSVEFRLHVWITPAKIIPAT